MKHITREDLIREYCQYVVGKMDEKNSNVGTGMVGAPACGDVMRLQIAVKDGIIEDAKFKSIIDPSELLSILMYSPLKNSLKLGSLVNT